MSVTPLNRSRRTAGPELRVERLAAALEIWHAVATCPTEPLRANGRWSKAVEGRRLAAGIGVMIDPALRRRLIALVEETLAATGRSGPPAASVTPLAAAA